MSAPLVAALQRLAAGRDLDAAQSAAAFTTLMRGEATAAQAAGLLMALRVKGETAEEVAGAVRALRQAMVRVRPVIDRPVIDTCGTGGGTVTTFNISTAAAFVAAGAGAAVAKHGNRSFTSRCGSADVLEALEIQFPDSPDRAAQILAEAGIVFLFAPHFHPAMRYTAPVRRELGVATIMNLLGPLANPAGVRRQVVGVADADRAELVAHALARLGVEHALVVHGRVGMDEIAPAGTTDVWEVESDAVRTWTIMPERWGLTTPDLDTLRGSGPAEGAARLTAVLQQGTRAPGSEAVVLNAAAALYVAGRAASYDEGVEQARAALDAGAGFEALERLRRVSTPG